MKLMLFVCYFLLVANLSFAQEKKNLRLNFDLLWENNGLVLEKSYFLKNGNDSIKITNLKFYLANIELWKGEKMVYRDENIAHLIDLSAPNSLRLTLKKLPNMKFDQLKFDFGLDSAINVSGVLGGDLDPTKGMYWTWQTGYIHLKLEGESKLCPTRNHFFQFHLGGYQQALKTQQKLLFKTKKQDKICFQIDIAPFFEAINLAETNQIMSPSLKAVQLSQKFTQLFKLKK
jgi:hypothetical protein